MGSISNGPGTYMLRPDTNAPLLRVVKSQGCFLEVEGGRRILDACAGAVVACLGHGDIRIREAIIKQLDTVPYAHGQIYTNDAQEELAKLLIDSTNGLMSHAFFMSSGSEALEAAVKLARQYHLEKQSPEPQRDMFISRQGCYHGATLATLSLSGHVGRKAPYTTMQIPNVRHTLQCNGYRKSDGENDEAYVKRLVDALEGDILACGTDRVCAFVAETVGGATSGAMPSVPGYFKAVRELCDKYGILIILDEIMCGSGRTGTMHAWQQEGMVPDIQAMGKGLNAGFVPLSAILFNHKIYNALHTNSGAFCHGQTFQAHILACAAALRTQQILIEDGLIQQCREKGDYLMSRLNKIVRQLPNIGDVRGRGLFVGIEFVKDKQTKEPFDPRDGIAYRVRKAIFDRNVAIYPGTGSVDGRRGDHLIVSPPYTVSHEEIDQIVGVLADAFRDVFRAQPH
ncbi:hypothetical protein CKM354_000610500 [Cercospora kikuchii]|uniref:Aminotransferase n=1 Tax=Cercospora kikuchii TaxID=84275 RepID=A0A9P3CGL3_9PEZI|nr:uncharacterized protein CKM354_000610500 [Cercospora kikuchii]GIZ42852.1 hypothetical protein CKM354_000610500 [Cercospora kikuchii]